MKVSAGDIPNHMEAKTQKRRIARRPGAIQMARSGRSPEGEQGGPDSAPREGEGKANVVTGVYRLVKHHAREKPVVGCGINCLQATTASPIKYYVTTGPIPYGWPR